MNIPVSRAKLQSPKLPQGYISRLRLMQKLEESQKKKLTLVIAGAGYGKSTLLTEWVQKKNNYVWYSLDGPDRDPAVFFAHLLTGLQEIWPDLGHETQAMLNRPSLPDAEHLMLALLSEIETKIAAQNGERPLLLFDDYHRLGDTADINAALKLLLANLPTSLHVIISSRIPLDFTARLELEGQVNKLTAQDMRFHDDEIGQILHGMDISSSSVQRFLRQTEGWVTGLQLLRQTLHHSHSLNLETLQSIDDDPFATIYAYLAEEMFDRQPEELQQFLLQTALLNNFSVEDCNTIFERSDSAHWLAYLVRQNLFTIHLQRDPDIYRYHHLLTDYLRQKVKHEQEVDQIQKWHRQAAVYYQQCQQWTEAFDQSHKARDESLAFNIISQACRPMLLAGQLTTVEEWFQRFSAEAYTAFPKLYSIKGDIWFEQGNYDQALGAYHQAIRLAESNNNRQALLNAWHGLGAIKQRTGDPESADSAFHKALSYVDEKNILSHLKVLIGLANNYKTTHKNRKAAEAYRKCLELAVDTDSSVQAIIMHNLGITLQEMGEFSSALHWLENALALRRKVGFASNIASTLNSKGLIHTVLGEFDVARQNLEEALDLCEEADSPVWVAYTLHSRGDLALAEQAYAAAEQYYRKSIAIKETLQDVSGLAATWVMMSELYRQQDNLEEATLAVHRALEPGKKAIGLNSFLLAQAVLARVLLAQREGKMAASILLEVVEVHKTITDNKFERMKSLWYLAQAQHILGEPTNKILATGLALAQRWNYRFLLSTLADEYPDLLVEAVAANLQPTLATDLLRRLGETAVPPLLHLLESPEPKIQIRAIRRLADLGVDGAWKPLAKLARDNSMLPVVKQEARKALKELKLTPPAPLFITTLGKFTIRRGDQLIINPAWSNSRQAQTLFKYLLQRTGSKVHREDMINLFWPETQDDAVAREKVGGRLNQLVSWVRQTLEPYLPSRYPSRYLTIEKEMYQLDLPDGSKVDVQHFEELMAKAAHARKAGNEDAMLAYLRDGVALYQGDYLAENRLEDWCIRRREQLKGLALQGFYELANRYLERNELETAVSYSKQLLELEPWHEEGCAVLIKALMQMGQFNEAQRACHDCREQLEKELAITDSPIINQLCRQISR